MSRGQQFTFGEKLRLCMKARECSQAALADKLGVERSTVNKWVLNRSVPSEEMVMSICKILALPRNVHAAMTYHHKANARGDEPASVFATSPSCFGGLLGLTRRQVAGILEGAQLLYFELFDPKSQESIRRLCGAYTKYCFSVRYRGDGLVYTSVVHIFEEQDGYYFREEHAGDVALASPPISFTGYALVLGPWLHLMGEDVRGGLEMTTGVYKIPDTFQFEAIDGLLIVGHLQCPDAVPFSTVACLEPISGFKHSDDIMEYLPRPGYFSPSDKCAMTTGLERILRASSHVLSPHSS